MSDSEERFPPPDEIISTPGADMLVPSTSITTTVTPRPRRRRSS